MGQAGIGTGFGLRRAELVEALHREARSSTSSRIVTSLISIDSEGRNP